MPLILGIDPGTRSAGYCLLRVGPKVLHRVKSGTIKIKNDSDQNRFMQLYGEVRSIVLSNNPDIIIVEDTFIGNNRKTALCLGGARGVILIAAYPNMTLCYSTTRIKKVVTGKGNSKKEFVKACVEYILDYSPKTLDESDAIAAALAYVGEVYGRSAFNDEGSSEVGKCIDEDDN